MPTEPTTLPALLPLSDESCDGMLRAAIECFGADELTEAEAILVGLVNLRPREARAIKLLAATLLKLQRTRDAELWYQRALRLDPDDPYVLVGLAELKLRALRIVEAVPLFTRLFELDPAGVHPAANRGRQLVAQYHGQLRRAAGQ